MKQLTQNWHLVRILQLTMGSLLLGSYFFYRPDGITLAFGIILLLQAVFNISCVGGACAPPPARDRKASYTGEEADEVMIEEIV